MSGTVVLHDAQLAAAFGSTAADFGVLTELSRPGASNLIDGSASHLPIWSANFVGTITGKQSISSITANCKNKISASPSSLSASFIWIDCAVPVIKPVHPNSSAFVEHDASNCAGECLPIHSAGPKGGNCDRLPGCGHDAGLPYCDVDKMKERCSNVSRCTAFNTNGYLYAGSSAVRPFNEYPLECWTRDSGGTDAFVNVTLDVTLASGLLEFNIAFDSDGSLSLWDYTISVGRIATTSSTTVAKTSAARQMVGLYDSAAEDADAVYFAAHDPSQIVKTCSANTQSGGNMNCQMMALNATLPLHHYKAKFPIVTTVITGDWWDIASLYRKWVIPNANWTKLGPLETRGDLPAWLENITLWMNNNWGGDPLRPNYGGDPAYVQNEMLKVNAVLDLPSHGGHLALHWYEWDTLGYTLGSNHTKNYFPARVGCKESVAAMQAAGMRVIPYINGQLYDTLIPRFKNDSAMRFVQKFVAESMDAAVTPHLEHFDGITSAVMCPHTAYWQQVMTDTMLRIVNDIGFDGVYVDQVGNGEKRNCGDPTHNHTIRGGSFWAEAFYKIMATVRSQVPPSMFMTEGITEEVSGTGFDILLGLDWQELPYWSAIYGGYGYATGYAGSISKPLANGLCAELTSQFMVGGTMGWFTYQNYGDQFFDPSNAEEVAYIQNLSQARIIAKAWMAHGRATRSLHLNDKTGSLQGGCFLRESQSDEASVVCAIALPSKAPTATYALDLLPSKYGLQVPAGSHVHLTNLATNENLGTFSSNVTYSSSLEGFGVHLLKLSVA